KVFIQAAIITERQTQKGILIGKQGSMLKNIGKKAREDIEALLGTKVYLEQWVKDQKDWRNKQSQLREYGFNSDEYKTWKRLILIFSRGIDILIHTQFSKIMPKKGGVSCVRLNMETF